MPKPLMTILFLTLASLTGLTGVVFLTSPYQSSTTQLSISRVGVFLGLLFSALAFGLTLTNYLFSQTLFSRLTAPRQQIRIYLRRYAILGLGAVALALLQLTQTLNPITASLLILTVLSLLYTLHK